ncbi:DUF4181 domain-containing protein [Bacillus sp. BRMEA1]|uniref:DUF4181 domain-containing protein n=1 Tax=Neobacillus endophyticus TaxID=2738405 RepID=UPI001565A22B|nr:DUF4181 domain-containing protein [Neobacillus endophyticus]NRD77303.1 DUF4181 domain-containing protein [Neobacillus endophyticus]
MIAFWLLIGYYVLYFGGNALLKKMFHIGDYSDPKRWYWSRDKFIILFIIVWFIFMCILVVNGILNQLIALLIGIFIPTEIWQGVIQYKNDKETRLYILNIWSIFSFLILLASFIIYSSTTTK